MKIEIRNYLAGSFLLETESKEWDSIVVLDSYLNESSFVEHHSSRSLQLKFDDVVKAARNRVEPNSALIQQALEFAKDSNQLVVCCRAGQSRSAALAFSIAFDNLGAAAAFELLNPRRHAPNERIVEIADGLIERPGLWNTFMQWVDRAGGIRLVDFLDEIERELDQLEARGARDRISGRM